MIGSRDTRGYPAVAACPTYMLAIPLCTDNIEKTSWFIKAWHNCINANSVGKNRRSATVNKSSSDKLRADRKRRLTAVANE